MPRRRAPDVHAQTDATFELLYRGYRGDVFRAALRDLGNAYDAEDVTQAAFVDAYRALRRGTRPDSPRAWLLAIVANVCRRRFRTAQRRPREEPLEVEAVAADEPSDAADALLAGLAELPPRQREVFLLREVAGLGYEEIAERTDSTVASVQMLLFRARKTLRSRLAPPALPAAFVPLPGWLAGVRADAVALAPRVAGVAGAVVLGVGGAGTGAVRGDASSLPPTGRAPAAAAPQIVPRAGVVSRSPTAAAARPAAVRTPVRAVRRVPSAATPPPETAAPALPAAPAATAAPAAVPSPAPAPPAPAVLAPTPPPVSAAAEPVVAAVEVVQPAVAAVDAAAVDPAAVDPVVQPLAYPVVAVVEPVLAGAGAAGAAPGPAPPLPSVPLDATLAVPPPGGPPAPEPRVGSAPALPPPA